MVRKGPGTFRGTVSEFAWRDGRKEDRHQCGNPLFSTRFESVTSRIRIRDGNSSTEKSSILVSSTHTHTHTHTHTGCLFVLLTKLVKGETINLSIQMPIIELHTLSAIMVVTNNRHINLLAPSGFFTYHKV